MSKTKLTLTNQCILTAAPPAIRNRLKAALTMPNPAHAEARKYGRYTGKIPRVLKFYEEGKDGSLSFPRGFLRGALEITGRNIVFEDRRRALPFTDFQFNGTLRPYQQRAVDAILRKDFGVLSAATGSGKTICALAVIAQRKQPTLVVVHSVELLEQWIDRIKTFLGVDVGRIGGGKYDVRPITAAITNSARRYLDKLPQYFGQIISDEVQHCPSTMLSEVVRAFDSKYMLSCSATPYRRDGLTKLIHWYVGPVVHKIDPTELQNLGAVLIPEIVFRQTNFRYKYKDDYAKMLTALTQDEERNILIVQDVLKEVNENGQGTVLIVSDRVQHCLSLADLFLGNGLNFSVKVLTGRLKSQERKTLVEDVRSGKVDVVIATIQLVGEGWDVEGLSSLFLATPIKWRGRLIQAVGRILRPRDGKTPRVWDYQDSVGVLMASAKARAKAYRSMGWEAD